MKLHAIFLLFFLLIFSSLNGQIIINDYQYSVPNLVEDILVSSECATIENAISEKNSKVGNLGHQEDFNSIAYFEKGDTNFPFERGIILSTTSVRKIPDNAEETLSYGSSSNQLWTGDSDLNKIVTKAETHNASTIEFDFIPMANKISFRYLMASEEYKGDEACEFGDVFAFILSGPGIDNAYPYDHDANPSTEDIWVDLNGKNIALIPGTNIPVSVYNINRVPKELCAANDIGRYRREEYYDDDNSGDGSTDFEGQTVVMTAEAEVIPGERYKIKLAIGDFQDGKYDSAVFIEAGSFELGADIGGDRLISNGNPACGNEPFVLESGYPDSDQFLFSWYKDGVLIDGANEPNYEVSSNGTYKVEIILSDNCMSTDEVVIEFADMASLQGMPEDLFICTNQNNGFSAFDLTQNTTLMLGGQSSEQYPVSFFTSRERAEANVGPIDQPENYTNQSEFNETIWMRISDATEQCFEIHSFNLYVVKRPEGLNFDNYERCDDDEDGDDQNGFVLIDKAELLQGEDLQNYDYYLFNSLALAEQGDVSLAMADQFTNETRTQTVYLRVESKQSASCYVVYPITIEVIEIPDLPNVYSLKQCDVDENPNDGYTIFNLTLFEEGTFDYTYFLTSQAAIDNDNALAIENPVSFNNNSVVDNKVYAKATNAFDCFKIVEIQLETGPGSISDDLHFDLEVCDVDDRKGYSFFNLVDIHQEIRETYDKIYDINYYHSFEDAASQVNPIDDLTAVVNTIPFNQKIWTRVTNPNNLDCVAMEDNIQLTVNRLPDKNFVGDLLYCSFDEYGEFDLNNTFDDIQGSQSDALLISFFNTQEDADANSNTISKIQKSQTKPVYTRVVIDSNANGIEDEGECFATDMQFNLRVLPKPVIENIMLSTCEYQLYGEFDLTSESVLQQIIVGNDAYEIVGFYEDLALTEEIGSPEVYEVFEASKTIYALVEDQETACTSVSQVELQVRIYPELNLSQQNITLCDDTNSGFNFFDLTITQQDILDGQSAMDFTFNYYVEESDALLFNDQYIESPQAYRNQEIHRQLIYVGVKSNQNDCVQTLEMELVLNPVPQVPVADQYVLCMDQFGQLIEPLDENVIETHLNELNYTFRWFYQEKLSDSQEELSHDLPDYSFDRIGFYTINVENKRTSCITSKTTQVIPSFAPEISNFEVEVSRAFEDLHWIGIESHAQGDFVYRLDDGDFQEEPRFDHVNSGLHKLEVRDIFSCGNLVMDVLVTGYPKIFTPNGDGVNDYWQIDGLGNIDVKDILIFDRYGKFIKKLNPGEMGWDGSVRGNKVISDDYWFEIHYYEENQLKKYRNHFTLKR